MRKVDAIRLFRDEIMPYVNRRYPHDVVAMRTAWNDWTDGMYKDGRITENQNYTWVFPFKFNRKTKNWILK